MHSFVFACVAIFAPAQAEEPPPPVPTGDAVPPEPPPSETPPAETPPTETPPAETPPPTEPTPEELEALKKAVEADTAKTTPTVEGVPDLSKVDIADALPAAVQSLNPDIAVIADTALSWFTVDEPQEGGAHDPTQNGFTLQAVELSIGASVDSFLRFDSNLLFSPTEVHIEEAYATTLGLPFNLQARAGQFLTRFGRINATHLHEWKFVNQTLVISKMFGSEGSRGVGGELSWLAPLPWFVELGGAVTNAEGECCARSYFGDENLGVKSPLDLVGTFTLKQFFPITPDWSLLFGVSAQTGPNTSGNLNRTEIYGVDFMLRLRPLESDTRWAVTIEGEGMMRGRQTPFNVLYDGGGYLHAVWNIDPQWETGARYDIAAGLEDDALDPEWAGTRHRGSLQVTYYPSHFSRLRLMGSMDAPSYLETPTFGVFATLEVVVGAHGSHSY